MSQKKVNSWQIVSGILLFGNITWTPVQNKLLAQSVAANPLEIEIDRSDPVIPLGYQKRQLSTFEINRIKREIKRLDLDAKQKLQGDTEQAFKLWYRQLKLARALGTETEIAALGRVGAIAWQANRGADLRNIANRLIAIESETDLDKLPSKQLEQLANSYQQVRYLDRAIAIYEQILAKHKQHQNLSKIAENRQLLGELYLSNFDYQKAANTYRELLKTALTKSPGESQISFYQQTLSDIYDRTGQTKQALKVKTDLIATYKTEGKSERLARLELAIATDYEILNRIPESAAAYERAFNSALAEQQLAIANDALTGLGNLYQKEKKYQKAIATYTRLLPIQRQSYNHYGSIDTHDRLGTIYLKLKQPQPAKQHFKQALELARGLDYRVNYFNTRIEQL